MKLIETHSSDCRCSLFCLENVTASEEARPRRSADIDELTQQVGNRKWIKPRAVTCALFARFQSGHGPAGGRTRPRNPECDWRESEIRSPGFGTRSRHNSLSRTLLVRGSVHTREGRLCSVLQHRVGSILVVTLSRLPQVMRNQAVVCSGGTRASTSFEDTRFPPRLKDRKGRKVKRDDVLLKKARSMNVSFRVCRLRTTRNIYSVEIRRIDVVLI